MLEAACPGCQDVAARLHWLFFTQRKIHFRHPIRGLIAGALLLNRDATRKEK
jgi:hypothetical protein